MSIGRILGIVLFAIGGILLIIGFSATGSFIDQAAYALTGRYSDATMAYLIGGGAAVVAGFLLFVFARRR